MKKKLTGFALLSSLFLLTACNATNTGGSGSGDSASKSEQVSGDSSETEEVSYDELYASVLDLYRPIALNGDTSAVPSDLRLTKLMRLALFLMLKEQEKTCNIVM